MSRLTVSANSRSQPFAVGQNEVLTVTGTPTTLEYTRGTAADIANGVAVWQPLGLSTNNDVEVNKAIFVRAVAASTAVTLTTAKPDAAGFAPFVTDTQTGPSSGSSGLTSAESFGASPSVSGAVNTTAINLALAVGGIVTISTPGTYVCGKSSTGVQGDINYDICLVIPSNTTLRLSPGVVLQAAAGLVNVALLQNSNLAGGNSNITIEGPGLFDGNSANVTRTDSGTNFACITVWLQNITDLTLKNVRLTNPRAWGIGIGACTRVRCSDTTFFYTCPVTSNQGGYQFQGANTDVIVRNTMGNPYDDMVAFVSEFPPQNGMAGPGPVADILIDGVISDLTTGCLHLGRLQGTAGNPITNATVRNLSGPYTDGAWTQVLVTGPTVYDGINCSPLTSKNPTQATVLIRNNFDMVSISNVNRIYNDTSESTKRATLEFGGGGTGGQLKISNVHIVDSTAAGSNVPLINIGNLTVTSLETSNLDAQSIVASNSLVTIANGSQIGRWTGTNIALVRIKQILNCLGVVGNGVWLSNVYSFANGASAFIQNKVGAFPVLSLTGVNLDSTQGAAAGMLNVTGVTGTMLVQFTNCQFNQAAATMIVRSAAEAIRVQSICIPVPNAILTQAVGDIFLDASNSNNAYRCSVAPSTFVAL